MPAQLKPPSGLPTPAASAEEEAWSSLIATQLADVRKTAENWRNGLIAIIGLITAFSIIKGPNDVGGLVHWAAYAVGALLLLALACAAFGAWNSLAAAYGTPSVITREDFRNLGGINGYRLDLASKGASKLRRAKGATIATLIFLAAAVGLTWYGPRSTSVILNVERKSQPSVCGKLVSSDNGYIDIKASTSEVIRVSMTDLVKVSAVEECP
jgi:hypothetical protein